MLLVFSFLFYAWGGVSYSAILIGSILVNYLIGVQIGKQGDNKKILLYLGIGFNISVILLFKYTGFFIENYNNAGQFLKDDYAGIVDPKIVLPLGISFFTFQQMSMLWDLYRYPTKTPIKFVDTALYVSFFPQLVAGPIVRYNDIIQQIKNRIESAELMVSGIRKFVIGLFKKIVLSNTLAVIADDIMGAELELISTPVAWLGIIAYAFQIYFDFSGYSDMAIGLGRMFGFRILENFNFPYISKSVKEFWGRWHISLSSWFRDYVYIPIGGNRKGLHRTYINLMLVFLLTGFWHGATWSFVLWGLFHGAFLIIERLGFDRILQRLPGVVSWAYSMIVVLVGWVFFRIEEISDARHYVEKMFGFRGQGDYELVHFLDKEKILILIIATLASSTFFDRIKNYMTKKATGKMSFPLNLSSNVILIGLFMYAIMYINSGSYNPFIYFRF